MDVPCHVSHPFDPDKPENIVGQQYAAHHRPNHRQGQQCHDHGLDKALGLKKTRISDAAFIYACYGVTIGALTTWYMMNHDWPQNIGGKPAFWWAKNMPAFVVPMFELMVFCAAHMMSLTFVIRNKMYPGAPAQNPDPRTTDDKFLIEFVSEDVDTIKQMLIDTGVEEITVKDA
jgi:hypothetical protein